MSMIYCTKCDTKKEELEFYKSQRRNDTGMCKKCFRACPSQTNTGKKKYHNDNKEKVKEWKANDYIKNRITYLLWGAKKRAKENNLEFTITREHIIIPEFCPILGIPIIIEAQAGRTGNGPSIDRLDNSKGYTPENILIVSDRANILKKDSTPKERELIFNFYKKIFMGQL